MIIIYSLWCVSDRARKKSVNCQWNDTSVGTVNRVLRVRSHSFYSANPPCVGSNNRVYVQFVPKRVRLSSSDKRGDTIISHFPIVLFQNDDSTNAAMKTACEPGSWPVLWYQQRSWSLQVNGHIFLASRPFWLIVNYICPITLHIRWWHSGSRQLEHPFIGWQWFSEGFAFVTPVSPNENAHNYTSQPKGSLFDNNKRTMDVFYRHITVL
jgi:hypothetical protein